MDRYLLGIDIGATKSHALVTDEYGSVLGFGEAGPGNHEVVGYEGLIAALQKSSQLALNSAGIPKEKIASSGFGIAGYDWPSELEPTQEAISHLGFKIPTEIVNDTIIGLVAGAESGWGIGLVSGTGCNCWGWDKNRNIGRVTGMGGWFGEYAGGSDIVRKGLVAVAYEEFRQGPKTKLTEAFIQLTGAKNAMDLFEGLTMEYFTITPSAAQIVFDAAHQGDRVSMEIIQWAGEELGKLANGVIRQINLENQVFDVVLIGSVFDGGEIITVPVKNKIHQLAPKASLVRLRTPPVVGGVLLAAQKIGIYSSLFRQRLLDSSEKFFSNKG